MFKKIITIEPKIFLDRMSFLPYQTSKSYSRHLLNKTAQAFELGDILSIDRLGGYANQNYAVKTSTGTFIIKVLKTHSKQAFDQEITYLSRILEYSIPIAPYLQPPSGDFLFAYDNALTLVLPKINGVHPDQTEETVSQLGTILGKLHTIPFNNLPARKNWLHTDYLRTSLAIIKKELPDDYPKFYTTFQSLHHFFPTDFPQSIVHGDLSRENCIFESNNLVALIDWEEVGTSAAILDVATCIQNMCYNTDILDPKLYTAFIHSYESVRSLTKEEKQNMGNALRYVGFTRSVWMLLQFKLYHPDTTMAKGSSFYWDRDLDALRLPH